MSQPKGQFIHLTAADGVQVPAYVAQPAGPASGSIVVVQEIFGVNAHIRAVADRYAAAGYLAVAPALFERIRPGVELGYSEADVRQGMGYKTAVAALPAPGVMPDIQAAIEHAAKASGGKVGIVGFCWGGLLSWRAACALTGLAAAVTYYGGGMTAPEELARQPHCPVLAHFADHDPSIPMQGIQAFSWAHPEVEVRVYPAHHGFNCDLRGAYNEAAACLARERTLAFFADRLA